MAHLDGRAHATSASVTLSARATHRPHGWPRERSSMVERQLPKLDTRVRFPSLAPCRMCRSEPGERDDLRARPRCAPSGSGRPAGATAAAAATSRSAQPRSNGATPSRCRARRKGASWRTRSAGRPTAAGSTPPLPAMARHRRGQPDRPRARALRAGRGHSLSKVVARTGGSQIDQCRSLRPYEPPLPPTEPAPDTQNLTGPHYLTPKAPIHVRRAAISPGRHL